MRDHKPVLVSQVLCPGAASSDLRKHNLYPKPAALIPHSERLRRGLDTLWCPNEVASSRAATVNFEVGSPQIASYLAPDASFLYTFL